MAYLARKFEIDIFKEGILLGFFFIVIGLLLFILNKQFLSVWLIVFSIFFFAFGGLIFFLAVFIPMISKRSGEILLFVWNESLYTFLGLPLTAICMLILPVSIFLLFFSNDIVRTGYFCLIFILSLQLSYLVYSSIKTWLNYKPSGHSVPLKPEKGPIEQLLTKISFSED